MTRKYWRISYKTPPGRAIYWAEYEQDGLTKDQVRDAFTAEYPQRIVLGIQEKEEEEL